MVSFGVHVICGVVLLTPVVVQDADVSKAVFAAGVSISVIATLSYGLKGSYTVEGTIIIPIFIVMLAIAMKMGLVLYNEMKADSSYEYATDMWLVDDFYNYQVLKEVVNEF